jgi:hypothetical protein
VIFLPVSPWRTEPEQAKGWKKAVVGHVSYTWCWKIACWPAGVSGGGGVGGAVLVFLVCAEQAKDRKKAVVGHVSGVWCYKIAVTYSSAGPELQDQVD